MLTERSKWQRKQYTITLATPNNVSVKVWHLNMPLQVIPWSPLCLFCVSGIHQERNYGSSRSTCPITVHERTAICKSQLEPIIENPGNTRGRNKLLVTYWQIDYTEVKFVRNAGWLKAWAGQFVSKAVKPYLWFKIVWILLCNPWKIWAKLLDRLSYFGKKQNFIFFSL